MVKWPWWRFYFTFETTDGRQKNFFMLIAVKLLFYQFLREAAIFFCLEIRIETEAVREQILKQSKLKYRI